MKSSKSIPGMAEKLERQRSKLEEALITHYRTLLALAPSLRTLPGSVNLAPINPLNDPVLLPSGLTAAQREASGVQEMARMEAVVRVGLGFDQVSSLQKALGMRSALSTRARKQILTRAEGTYKTAEMQVRALTMGYRRNWAAMDQLAIPTPDRKGLQVLLESHVQDLSKWLSGPAMGRTKNTPEQDDRDLPWIWTVNPIEEFDVNSAPEAMQAYVERWNFEGGFDPLSCSLEG